MKKFAISIWATLVLACLPLLAQPVQQPGEVPTKVKRTYGWKRDLPRLGVPQYTPAQFVLTSLPPSADLRSKMPPVYDQGSLGSCVDNATAGVLQYSRRLQNLPDFTPSRLFLYYNARALEGTISYDSGSSISDGIRAAARWGYVDEVKWPYVVSKFRLKPPAALYTNAARSAIRDYASVGQNAQSIQAAVSQGHPVVIGFTVYDSFESQATAQTGIVTMPRAGEQVLGGHAVVIVGYDMPKQTYVVRNSWGSNWGDKGYCYFPMQYVHSPSLASDFWVVNTVPRTFVREP